MASTARVAEGAICPTRWLETDGVEVTLLLPQGPLAPAANPLDRGPAAGRMVDRPTPPVPPRSSSPPACCPGTAVSAVARPRFDPRRWQPWPRPPPSCGHLTSPGASQIPGQAAAGRDQRAVWPAPWMGGRAGQRRIDGILGRGPLSLIETRSLHLSFGEFSSKFAAAAAAAPFLDHPVVINAEPGTHPALRADGDVDVYALTHNETSTGVAMTPRRPTGATDGQLVAGRRHLGRGRAALGPRRGGRVLLRSPEVPGVRWGAVHRLLLPGSSGPHRALEHVGPLDPHVHRSQGRPRQQPAGPDQQHPRAGHAVPGGASGGVAQPQRRARRGPPAAATARQRTSTAGPTPRPTPPPS